MIFMTTNDNRVILCLFRLGKNDISRGCTLCQRQPEKVICLGEEQAFWIQALLTDNPQWEIEGKELQILDEEFLHSVLRCDRRKVAVPVLWDEQLSEDTSEEEAEETAMKDFLESQHGEFRYWNKICEPIVLMLGINSCNSVSNRNTLVHLCMNSQYGAELFRKVVMRLLNLMVIHWFDQKKQEAVAKFLIDFLKRLSDYEYRLDVQENIEKRGENLCDRIKGSNIDVLYKEVDLRNKEKKKAREKGEDILKYFARLEGRPRIYYASRLALIQRIITKKLDEGYYLPDSFIQLNGEREETNYTKKIREVIDSIDAQDKDCQKEAIARLSGMLDLCVMEWIDEEVTSMHKWMLGEKGNKVS